MSPDRDGPASTTLPRPAKVAHPPPGLRPSRDRWSAAAGFRLPDCSTTPFWTISNAAACLCLRVGNLLLGVGRSGGPRRSGRWCRPEPPDNRKNGRDHSHCERDVRQSAGLTLGSRGLPCRRPRLKSGRRGREPTGSVPGHSSARRIFRHGADVIADQRFRYSAFRCRTSSPDTHFSVFPPSSRPDTLGP